jgi:hypothetical protein
MADKKISALTAASTPLAGTEVLPIVQSGATVKVAVSNLTAGRAIGATSIQLGSGTPLAVYEEGTWTPSVGGNATYYAQGGNYTRVGNKVYVSGTIVINVLGTGSATTISGLPFVPTNAPASFVGVSNFSSLALAVTYIAGYATGSTIVILSTLIAATGISTNNVIGNSTRLDFACTYLV